LKLLQRFTDGLRGINVNDGLGHGCKEFQLQYHERMTIALAGRRIDAPGAEVSRFPLANVERVRQELRELFARLKPSAVISSAACGTDLIGLQVAGESGIRRRVVLPFDSAQFLETSVIDRPGDWAGVYQDVIKSAQATGDLIILSRNKQDFDAYLLTTQTILDEAYKLSETSDGEIIAVLVWDGSSRGEDDLTEVFRAEAEKRGLPVHIIRSDQKPDQRDMAGASRPN
jgi:hypothetical protein